MKIKNKQLKEKCPYDDWACAIYGFCKETKICGLRRKKMHKERLNKIIVKGRRFPTKDGKSYLRIMAVEEGYVMGRFKGAAPFCMSLEECSQRIKERCLIA